MFEAEIVRFFFVQGVAGATYDDRPAGYRLLTKVR